MSERPHDGSGQDPANTQMFRAFVERGEEEDTGRRRVLPVVLLVVLAVAVLVVVLLMIG